MKIKSLFFILILTAAILIPGRIMAESNPILVNPGFEAAGQDPWYWWGEAGTGDYGTTEYVYSGKKSVKIVADGEDFIPMGLLQEFECQAGRKITASAWIMSPPEDPLTNSNAFVKLEFWGEDPFNPLEAYESEHLTDAFKWTKSTISSKAPEGTTKAKVGLFIWNPKTGHSGTVYFDDAKVSRGAPLLF